MLRWPHYGKLHAKNGETVFTVKRRLFYLFPNLELIFFSDSFPNLKFIFYNNSLG